MDTELKCLQEPLPENQEKVSVLPNMDTELKLGSPVKNVNDTSSFQSYLIWTLS